MTKFYVIDHEDNVSWFADEKDSSNDGSESFTSLKKAEERAKELADLTPGYKVHICKVVAEVLAPVGPTVINEVD